MADPVERRRAPRVALVGRPGRQTQEGLPVWLTDLSTSGARLTHLTPFYPGTVLTLQLLPDLDGLQLAAQVVWTKICASEETLEPEHHAVYQSGTAFVGVTPEQRVALERLVDRFRQGQTSGNDNELIS